MPNPPNDTKKSKPSSNGILGQLLSRIDSDRSTTENAVTILGAIGALGAVLLFLYTISGRQRALQSISPANNSVMTSEDLKFYVGSPGLFLDESQNKLGTLETALQKIQKDVANLATGGKAVAETARITKLENELHTLSDRLKGIEASISADPEKAISLPLLRKDMAIQEAKSTGDSALIRRDVDEVYQILKIVGSALLGFIGLIGPLTYRNTTIRRIIVDAIQSSDKGSSP